MVEKIISMKNYASADAPVPYGDDYSFLDDMTQEEIRAYIEEVSAKCPRVHASKINIEDQTDSGGLLEMTSSFPVCNHTEGVGPENIGYSQGVLSDGTPYEAELWNNREGGQSLTVLIPVQNFALSGHIAEIQENRKENTLNDLAAGKKEEDMELPSISSSDCGVLAIGMVEDGEEDDITVTFQYVEYLAAAGILRFTGEIRNGFVGYMIDISGTELAYIIVTLSVRGRTDAETNLHFRPFLWNYRTHNRARKPL